MYEFNEIFSKKQNEKIAREFSSLKDNYYLEHVGATLYSDRQIQEVFEELKGNLFGNPHAFNTSSTFTEDIIDQVRSQILQHFKTTQDEYTIIFTSGATGALKIVAETFNYTKNGILIYLQDNHTSVMGMRQHVKTFKVLQNDDAFKTFNTAYNVSSSATTNSLFVYPAQSNFSGTKYPLNWIEKVQKGALNNLQNEPTQWFCMLDAASFVSSNELNLHLYKPDFVCMSFYKIFGYPTGLGALIVKNTSAHVLQKKYFGGGTVQMAVDEEHVFRQSLHERFEDGTLPFLSIISVRHGFKTLQRLSLTMNAISEHTFNLAKYVHHNLLTMHHFNNQPVAILYHDTDFEDPRFQGGVVNFNLLRSNGKYIGYSEVLQMANLHKIHLRTGCFCNPGACQKHLKLRPVDVKHQYNSGHVCGDQNDLIEGQPTGSIRISFGYMSRKMDADKLLQMIEACFASKPLVKKLPKSWKTFQKDCGNKFINQSVIYNNNNNNDSEKHNLVNNGDVVPRNKFQKKTDYLSNKVQGTLTYIFLYPIKSCGAYSVTKSWDIYSMGLKYDREWMIATIAGVCFTQKQEPKLCLLTPKIDLDKGVLQMYFPEMPTIAVSLQVNEIDKTSEFSICQSKICGKQIACIDCGDEIADWLNEAFQRSDLRLFRQNNDYIRTNQKHQTQLSLVNEAQYLLINIASIKHLANAIPNYERTIIDLVLRFRANLVVKTDVSFIEQSCKQVRIGDNIFKSTGPCTRCQMICIDQVTAEKTVEPLKTLSSLSENRIRFGVYLSHENAVPEQQLSVNEAVIFE